MFNWRIDLTFDVARAMSVGLLIYICTPSGMSSLTRVVIGMVCFLIIAYEVKIQKSKDGRWGIRMNYHLYGRDSNRFMTLAGVAKKKPKEVIPDALRVYERVVTECAVGGRYFREGNRWGDASGKVL